MTSGGPIQGKTRIADRRRIPILLSVCALVLAAVGFLGIVTKIEELSGLGEGLPIAPSSSIVAVILSLSLIGLGLTRHAAVRWGATLASASVLVISVLALFSAVLHPSFDIEHILYPYHKTVDGVDLGHMSPLAAIGYSAIGMGVIFSIARKDPGKLSRQASSLLTTGAFLAGAVAMLGYAYGSPLLYGSTMRPIALIAAIALFALGVSATMLMGSDSWPLRAFVGPSVRARLLRAFLPVTSFMVLVVGWTYSYLLEGAANPAIVASSLAVASSVIVAIVVSRIAGSIGGQIDRSNRELRRTQESLKVVNNELESFSYSVSHDLRSPLRAVDGFAEILEREYSGSLDDKGKEYLSRVRGAAQKMEGIIDDLLELSRATKTEMRTQPVDLAVLANDVAARISSEYPDHRVEFASVRQAWAHGDPKLLEIALVNILGNSWKFTSKKADARVEFGTFRENGTTVYYVHDNGAGFDPAKASKLFAPFTRLHNPSEFPGSGIGLATVQRIVNRHGGDVWAEGAVGQGATIFFTIGEKRPVKTGAQSETMSST